MKVETKVEVNGRTTWFSAHDDRGAVALWVMRDSRMLDAVNGFYPGDISFHEARAVQPPDSSSDYYNFTSDCDLTGTGCVLRPTASRKAALNLIQQWLDSDKDDSIILNDLTARLQRMVD